MRYAPRARGDRVFCSCNNLSGIVSRNVAHSGALHTVTYVLLLFRLLHSSEGSQRMMYPRANLQRSRRMEKQSLPSLVAYSPRIRGKAGAKPVIVRVRIPPTEKTMDLQMSTKVSYTLPDNCNMREAWNSLQNLPSR